MTDNFGDILSRRRGKQQRAGVGLPVNKLPPEVLLRFDDFRGGLDLSEDAYNIAPNASPDCLDVELDDQGYLKRMPGILLVENLAPHDPQEMFAHGDLDGNTDIVLFDSPFMGVKIGNDPTDWYNVGLPAGDAWTATNHGGVLVFTNGSGAVFARAAGATTVSNLGWGPAKTVLSFAGRVYAGGATVGGVFNPLGMFWTGASGEEDDDGLGSNAELLLSEAAEGDRIMLLSAMGFDLMAIYMRKSIWAGRRTGDFLRPVDFFPRVTGVGLISLACHARGPAGIHFFLSDDGVKAFNGSTVEHLSRKIDKELLPLQYSRIKEYAMVYSPVTGTLRLFTPDRTYQFDITDGRWLRSSAKINRATVLFSPATVDFDQAPAGWGLYWSGSWGRRAIVFGQGGTGLIPATYMPTKYTPHYFSLFGTDMVGTIGPNIVLADLVYLIGSSLSVDNSEATAYLGQAQNPYWTTKIEQPGDMDMLFSIKRFTIEMKGPASAPGIFSIEMKKTNGDFRFLFDNKSRQLSDELRVSEHSVWDTARDVCLRLRIKAGAPVISRFNLKVVPRSEAVA